jgi:hypothetical protein
MGISSDVSNAREPQLLEAQCEQDEVTSQSPKGPPRAWVLMADWGNTVAGIFLMGAFLEGALLNSVKMSSLLDDKGIPTESSLDWLQFLFCAEGFCYGFAEFWMVGIMALTPAEFGGGSRGCIQFAILMAGGIFFGFSGLAYPGCITNLTYVFRKEACPFNSIPYAFNAVAHYGITCFMTGTSIGLLGVLQAPKNKIVSPFYGCLMYFLGAWTIGIFKFWGPVLAGGFTANQNVPLLDMDAPTNAWTWTWWLALLGAFFLELGAVIFGLMNGSFGIKCA